MMIYTDQDLEAMLLDLGSDLTERQESFQGSARREVREAVCAFANDLPDHRRPGVIFIGARSDGSPSGLGVTDDLRLQLAKIKTDGNIVPSPTLTLMKRTLRGADMAIIAVQPADSPPVRLRGRVFVRFGSRHGIATPQDERVLTDRRRRRDRADDVQPVPDATLPDLSRRLFEELYLPSAIASEAITANHRTYEQRLAAARMVTSAEQPTPTVLGVLTLANQVRHFLPGAYIQFLRVAGDSLGDPIVDEQLIDGPIHDVLRLITEKMASHNRVAVDITSGPTETRREMFPLAALQQLVRNAVVHRTYDDTHAPVRVYWFDDRIEISNPGGPYGTVTTANFGRAGLSDYRNPNLAEVLRSLGLVQRYGAGIPIAQRALERNGSPPTEFTVERTHVSVTVWRAPLPSLD